MIILYFYKHKIYKRLPNADDTDDLALVTNTPAQANFLWLLFYILGNIPCGS